MTTTETSEFLTALYGGVDGHYHLIWTLQDKRSAWFTDPLEAAAYVAKQCQGKRKDVYCSVGLEAKDQGEHRRTSNDTVVGIVGFAADVDIARGAHDGKPYPPTEEDAFDLLSSTGLPPTIVVHSGHGLQAWWLFREPWTFVDDAERDRALGQARGWGRTIKELARRRSWVVDSVFDAARVMRIPGTTNHKQPDAPVPVTTLPLSHLSEQRYNPDDFEPWMLADPEAEPGPAAAPTVHLDLPGAAANFPHDKHEALQENSPEYKATWKHTRRDMQDKSCSGYDLALTNYMVGAGFSDAEVAAVLRTHRAKWGTAHPEKLDDARYYQRTIARVRGDRQVDQDREEATFVLASGDGDRQEKLKAIGVRLGIGLERIEFVTGNPARFRFFVNGRCAELPATALVTQAQFQGAMLSLARVMPKAFGPKEKPGWRDCVNVMAEIAEEIDAGEDATVDGELRSLLDEYLSSNRPADCPVGRVVEEPNHPFLRDGRVWFRLNNLIRFATLSMTMRIGRGELAQRLAVCGCERKSIKVKRASGDEKDTTLQFFGHPWPME